MTTPNRVRACVDQLAANGGGIDERIDRLDVRGAPDQPLIDELRAASQAWRDEGFGTLTVLDSLGDELDLDANPEIEGQIRLIIGKKPTASTFYFLTEQGIRVLLSNLEQAAAARRVLVAAGFDSFRTASCAFESWTEMVPDETEADRLKGVVPRRIVRDQLAIVPLSIGPILLTEPPAQPSEAFHAWRSVASKQLLITLCDEVWSDAGTTTVALTGPRKRRLTAELDGSDPQRDLLPATQAAAWVYDSGRDVETRHTLFTYELAREWPEDTPFAEAFAAKAPAALEAAQAAFRLHVREASKETLKSLQDLRKSLSEEVTRVVTQTRELAATMWRDLLVVVAALLGRFALVASPKPAESKAADWLLLGIAGYLAFSIIATVASNASFMGIFRRARSTWQTKLYGFLDPSDLDTLATKPLNTAETTYRWTRSAACVAYALVIVGLLLLASTTDPNTGAASDNALTTVETEANAEAPANIVVAPSPPAQAPTGEAQNVQNNASGNESR